MRRQAFDGGFEVHFVFIMDFPLLLTCRSAESPNPHIQYGMGHYALIAGSDNELEPSPLCAFHQANMSFIHFPECSL